MSIIQGYSSDSDEDSKSQEQQQQQQQQQHHQYHQQQLSDTSKYDSPDEPLAKKPRTQLDRKAATLFEERYRQEQALHDSAKLKAKQLKLRRKKKGVDPWTSYSDDDEVVVVNESLLVTTSAKEQIVEQTNDDEGKNSDNDADNNAISFNATSQFVGTAETDYQGRSFMRIPRELKDKVPGQQECFVPKNVIHTFTKAHPKGVNKIQFFPKSGHLLLSCGNDGSIKLWSVYNAYELLRIYKGHKLAVKDICFNSTGDKFLSCSYDNLVRLWNTETGEVLRTLQLSTTPNALRFHPNNDSEFIIGLSNHKIHHYDLNALRFQDPVQIYDHHVGSINALMTTNDGFISTADDKTVRVWPWRVNIPTKVVSDAALFSMPALKKHPRSNYIALQSMDNSIKVISSTGKYKWNKKKLFKGHHCAGYGIDIDFSPDGKIIMSGDSKGYAFFWDWQSKKLVKKLKLSNVPIKTIASHPLETSKVAIAGVSGDIYYCD
ncbi:hypothetical protein KGF56_004201 [Candida oxycetoniae]|uniref:Pre-mRNA-processing factor 17 n=1 Tax=Candida oxycetoniae TaxID=497107 RepID=A0AAI9WWP6_9ASCO|nr:uncharacterized protein KGF56_004201 [Candida oxycetoniae]KAI3402949.2 hypothetical protein KGF56_004201 [Candida oxycetoniae]